VERAVADTALRPAVFLDRDGTVCEEVGYLNHASRLQIFPFAAAAVRQLNDAGLPVIVVTNQSGISHGMFPQSLVEDVHQKITAHLAAQGARLDGFYYCSHQRQDQCNCRKPLPGLLERAAEEHGLDLANSFVVGDRYLDVELAHSVRGRGVLVLTGYGLGEYELHAKKWARQPDAVVKDLGAAAEWIRHQFAEERK
jgi:D-glycero-D-manno-heptose 1,7-bisphosphate phosphatase